MHLPPWSLFRLGLLPVALLAALASSPSCNSAEATREVRPDHPRVWLTPERLARLRNAAASNSVRWQKVRARAEAIRRAPRHETADIPVLALAYQVTGQPGYAHKAIEVLLEHLPKIKPAADSYYFYRIFMPDLVAGFDWCYDRMNAGDRKQIAGWLMDRADEVWPETNPKRKAGWSINDPANNYYYGFLMTWPAALAAHGDDSRAPRHLELALSKYRKHVRAFTDGWGAGGVFPESTNYDSSMRLASVLDAHLTATGEDLVNEDGFAFLRDSLYWRIYSSVPTRDFVYPLGDQARESLAPLCDYDRERALFSAADVKDQTARGYIQYWLDTIRPAISQWGTTVAWEFLYYDDHLRGIDYGKELPTSYFAPGPGLLVKRSSWREEATYWGIWAGPLRESHQSQDVNGFKIFKGGWLLGDASIWSHSGILSGTANHNNLTVGGKAQSVQVPNSRWPEEAGKVIKYEDQADYTYFVGSGAQAYVNDRNHGGTKMVNDYVRKFVYVTDDLFFIYDRVTPVDARLEKAWHLHAKKPISSQSRTYSFDNGKYRLFGEVVLPATGVQLETEPIHAGARKEVTSSHRLNVHVKDGKATGYLLNVLQVAPLSRPSPLPVEVVKEKGVAMEGARAGDWVVLFGKKEAVASAVSYEVAAAPAVVHHLLLDMKPKSAYHLSVRDESGREVRKADLVSSNHGAVRFDTQAGETRFTVAR